MNSEPTLHFFCGKMASGKSTLARKLAIQHNAILMVEDEWLTKLYPEEISDLSDYVTYSLRLKKLLLNHIRSILSHGTPVVLDFPANTKNQRGWLRAIYLRVGVPHVLHYIDVSDEVCKRQLRKRSKDLPEGTKFTTDAEFDAFTRYFQAPAEDEGFNIVRYQDGVT